MIRTLTVALALILVMPVAAVEKLLPPPGNPVPGHPPGAVVGWLQPLAGKSAAACGTHRLAETQSPALSCATDAIRQSKPFWIVFEGARLDSGGWTGVAMNSDGKAWSVRFDSGSTMQNVPRPHSVTVLTCDALSVEGAHVRCEGS